MQRKLSLLLLLQLQLMTAAYRHHKQQQFFYINNYFHERKKNLKKRIWLERCKKRRKERSCWVAGGRTDHWWKKMIWENIPDHCWRRNFRMSKEAFKNLATKIDHVIAPDNSTPNYRYLTTEKKLAITLYYLKDTCSL